MTIFSNRVKNLAKVYIVIASVFVFAGFGITFLGSLLTNYYILGIAVFVCGVCDCMSMSIALSLAGTWEKSGITAYNLCQCLGVAVSTMLMVFL